MVPSDEDGLSEMHLQTDEASEYAKRATVIRETLLCHAVELARNDGQNLTPIEDEAIRSRFKLPRRMVHKGSGPFPIIGEDDTETATIPSRRKHRAKRDLSTEELEGIVHSARILQRSYTEISLEYNVSSGLVTRLMKAVKDDETLIERIKNKETRQLQL